jgi:hypothetical protein
MPAQILDLISGRNDGKGSHAITGKVESVSEYSAWRIDMREAEVLISADPGVGRP